MKVVLMKCGHSANAVDSKGNPCCAICAGLTPNANIVEKIIPDLTNRFAKCSLCNNRRPSSIKLPFFKYEEDSELDSYYCGCRGWE